MKIFKPQPQSYQLEEEEIEITYIPEVQNISVDISVESPYDINFDETISDIDIGFDTAINIIAGGGSSTNTQIWDKSSAPPAGYIIWASPKNDNSPIRLTYSNERVEQNVGNVKIGEKFENEDIVQILDRIFAAAYTKPSISIGLSCKTLYDKDTEELPSVTITANVTKKSEDISYVKYYVDGVLVNTITTGVAAGGVFKYTYTPDTTIKKTTTFKVETCDKDTKSVVTTQSNVTFVQKSYWGVVPSILDPTDNDVITVLNNGLKTSVSMTQKFTTEYGRFVFAYPKAIGSVKSIKDNVNNFNYTDSCSRASTTISGGAYEIIYLTDCAGFDNVSITFA